MRTIDFDVNFLNFEDPAVLARFTGPDYVQYWKETYGFDNVIKLAGTRKRVPRVWSNLTAAANQSAAQQVVAIQQAFNRSTMPIHCAVSEFR